MATMSACETSSVHFEGNTHFMLGEEGKLSTFSKEDQIIGIQPSYRMHSGMEDVFLKSVQMHLPLLLPSFFIEELSALPKDANAWSLFQRLHAALPAFSIASFERTAQAYLCSLGQGLASHLSDRRKELSPPYRSGETPSLQEGVLQLHAYELLKKIPQICSESLRNKSNAIGLRHIDQDRLI